MHARPGRREDGTVRLHRLREVSGQPQRIWIDHDFLTRQKKAVYYWTRRVGVAHALPMD
jgi:hypothetical protein